MSTNANFAATPRASSARASAASANPDGSSGGLVAVFTGGASGSRVDSIQFKANGATYAAATTVVSVIRLYVSPDGGTTKYLIKEIAVPVTTPSVSAVGYENTTSLGIYLPSASYQLMMGVTAFTAGCTMDATAFGGDF